jgi:hypothetical protein
LKIEESPRPARSSAQAPRSPRRPVRSAQAYLFASFSGLFYRRRRDKDLKNRTPENNLPLIPRLMITD